MDHDTLETVDLDVEWHHGWPSAKHDPAPEIQSHHANDRTVIMRQSKSVSYEAPFMFLLFGERAAVLVDTGATPEPEYFPLRTTVDAHIEAWLERNPRHDYHLYVVHTHGHGDHKAADAQFEDRPHTTVVGADLDSVKEFYGFADWPATPRELDLGGRTVDVVPGPGHHASAVHFYDRATGLLLTGDTVYPGRLYVLDWAAYAATIDGLVEWTRQHPVSHVLGCHIEMSIEAGQDYPFGWSYQPYEAKLPMTVAQLEDVQSAVCEIDGKPGKHVYDDFHIWYGVEG